MPNYKLNYFSLKAFGEPIRFLLSYLEQDFEDNRIERVDWPSIKPSTPFGKIPVLEIDGKRVHQSTAISRFLGKKGKIAGKDSWEALQIDIAVETVNDFRSAVIGYWYESDETVKARNKEIVLRETVPFYLKKLDKQVKNNGGYLANGELSWADLYFIALSDYINVMLGYDLFEKTPNLNALKNKVVAIPQIAAWIAKRPESEM